MAEKSYGATARAHRVNARGAATVGYDVSSAIDGAGTGKTTRSSFPFALSLQIALLGRGAGPQLFALHTFPQRYSQEMAITFFPPPKRSPITLQIAMSPAPFYTSFHSSVA